MSCQIHPIRILNIIFWCRFFCPAVQLARMTAYDVIGALATNVGVTQQTAGQDVCSIVFLKHVTSQHCAVFRICAMYTLQVVCACLKRNAAGQKYDYCMIRVRVLGHFPNLKEASHSTGHYAKKKRPHN